MPCKCTEALKPFAEAAREFKFAIAPDGHDDGLTIRAQVCARPERVAMLGTADFSRARAAYAASLEAQCDVERLRAENAELRAALKKILSEGTRISVVRDGDMYDLANGISDEAKIARTALSKAGGSDAA